MSSCPNVVPVAPRPSSRPIRPCASRFFLCDTTQYPDSVPVPEPKRLPDMYALNSSQIVPRPKAGLNPQANLSRSADIALLGEPSLIFSPNTVNRQYLPCISDLLPEKQRAPANNPGESKNSTVNSVPSGTKTQHEPSCLQKIN